MRILLREFLEHQHLAFAELCPHQSSVLVCCGQLTRTDLGLGRSLAGTFISRLQEHSSFRGEARFSNGFNRIAYNCFREDARNAGACRRDEAQLQAEHYPQTVDAA